MHLTRWILLAALPLFLVPSPGCRQLLRGADEALEVGRRADGPTTPGLGRRAAGQVVKEGLQYTVTQAIAAAGTHDAAPGTDLPDLDGRWRQTDDFGDGFARATIIDRKASQPGVYDVTITSTLMLEDQVLMTAAYKAVEVLSRKRQCHFLNSLEVQYATDEVQQLLESESGPLTLATFNNEPCSDILSVDDAMIRGVSTDGVTFVEVRSPL